MHSTSCLLTSTLTFATLSKVPVIDGVRYAFYFGKINKQGNVGLITSIVLSSDKKVFKITDMNEPVEMFWVNDPTKKGKRGHGHIYLGALTGGKGFETYIHPVFQSELGIYI